ncbi:UDP-N-acetylmuramoyl-L-alanyl-D-glutamate--2, 6-diaminopimelate ligase [Anaerolineae bacterium]|nr:UDP-N-acetylmuramoyl-L-alanyl-D-glutamate--2, 6-diaminopimelate ligase [Anaerolineae bacterium]
MRFGQLLDAVPGLISRPQGEAEITGGVYEDHRALKPGAVFVARQGKSVDSHDFIDAALAAGAGAVVGERSPEEMPPLPVPYAQVSSAGDALGYLAAAFQGFPSRNLTMIGVTGTDGKTTTTNLIYHMLKAAGRKVGMISTISAVIGDEDLPTGLHVTTPSAPDVQGYLRRMVDAGLTHCVLETTSHGLAQGRVNGVAFDLAVMTNVTHEHLDYHGTFENYRAAKGLLFEKVAGASPKPGVPKAAVINGDDPSAAYFLSIPIPTQYRYSLLDESASVFADQIRFSPDQTHFRLQIPGQGPLEVATTLVGDFNILNIMAAAAVGSLLGCSGEQIQAGIAALPLISGRMERINEGQDFLAIVDFAHTPNALLKALSAARNMTTGQVIAVFGSAGLRDVEKRRMMAEYGAELADICILTAEDPRTESLDAILESMAVGARSRGGREGRTFYRVPDRGVAIALGCALANPGDLVIACGKGHEQSMCFGTVEHPWDDREAMRAALRGKPLKRLPTMQVKGSW